MYTAQSLDNLVLILFSNEKTVVPKVRATNMFTIIYE